MKEWMNKNKKSWFLKKEIINVPAKILSATQRFSLYPTVPVGGSSYG